MLLFLIFILVLIIAIEGGYLFRFCLKIAFRVSEFLGNHPYLLLFLIFIGWVIGLILLIGIVWVFTIVIKILSSINF